jgi:hypothetical protein
MLDAATYPAPAVRRLVAGHCVAVKVWLHRPADQAHFKAYRVIWTPTVAVLDHRGAAHYTSAGYLPPDLFAAQLRIGLARALLPWSRHAEAAAHLEAVAADPAQPFAPEALFWLGMAYYLPTRRRSDLMRAWGRLRAEHPASLWAARVPPNQDDGSAP